MPAVYSGVANGNIVPSRFISADTTTDNRLVQTGANGKIVGVAGQGTRNTPYQSGAANLNDGNIAIAGENFPWYGPTDTCWLEVGGVVTAGDYLESDSQGRGVTSSVDGHFYGAIAQQSAPLGAGTLIKVVVTTGMRGA